MELLQFFFLMVSLEYRSLKTFMYRTYSVFQIPEKYELQPHCRSQVVGNNLTFGALTSVS